jgi:hypothetical protein
MRPAQLAPLALFLLPMHSALAAEPAKGATSRPAAEAKPAASSDVALAPLVSADGTGAAPGAKGLVFGVNQLPTIGGFYYVSPVGSVRAGLGFTMNFKPAVNAQFAIDASYRHHLLTGDLRPFAEGGISFGYAGDINFALGGGLGVEYFIVPRLSVSGIVGAQLRFDNGGDSISIPLATTGLMLNVFL